MNSQRTRRRRNAYAADAARIQKMNQCSVAIAGSALAKLMPSAQATTK